MIKGAIKDEHPEDTAESDTLVVLGVNANGQVNQDAKGIEQ